MSDILVPAEALTAHVAAIFAAAGNAPANAHAIATHLVSSNLAGHESHGVIRVPLYLDWQRAGRVVPDRAGRVVADSGALVTIDGRAGLANCRGDTLTATRTASGHFARSAQAVRSAHSPIWAISPASSATGMKRAGEMAPCTGWFQRSRASKPVIFSVVVWTTGW